MRVAWVQFFDFPSPKAHAMQILQSAAALAREGVGVWCFPKRRAPGASAAILRETFAIEAPAQLHIEPVPTTIKALCSLRYRRRLLRFARGGDRPVFVARQLRHALWLDRQRRRRGLDCRLVYEFHNLEHRLRAEAGDSPGAARLRAQELAVCRRADALIAIGEPLADDLRELLDDGPPVHVLPDGVDLERFGAITPPPPIADRLRLVYAGSLYPEKGADRLLDCLAACPSEVELTVVGGNAPADLARMRQRAAADPTLRDRVRFTGRVPPARVPEHLAAADAILIPAGPGLHSRRYTSPLKLFESMAAGLPVIAPPTPAIASVLVDGQTGLLAPGESGADLAVAVRRLLADRAAAAAIGRRSRAAAATYSWQARGRSLAAFLRTL